MELVPTKKLHLFAGRSHPALADEIAEHLGVELGETNLREFANGEIHCRFGESIRGADVFILQTHHGRVNDFLMEQLIMIDAAKRASAKRITAVCPRYGYARQDRKAEGREPITAKLVADMLTVAGADRVVSVDLHTGQIQGFFDQPVDHLTALPLMIDYLQANAQPGLVVVSPDSGGMKQAKRLSGHLGCDLAFVNKTRPKGQADTVVASEVIGDVQGRPCVLLDDEVSTAGTICAAAETLVEHGASDVWALATHAILSDPATDRIKNSVISRMVLTNTVPLPPDKQLDKIEVVSIAPIIANAIEAVFQDSSVSEIFDGENQS